MEWRLATSFPRPTCYRDEDEGLSPADDNDDQKGEDEEDIALRAFMKRISFLSS